MTYHALLEKRLGRRTLLRTGISGAAFMLFAPVSRAADAAKTPNAPVTAPAAPAPVKPVGPTLNFVGLDHAIEEGLKIAEGYHADILLRWGDPILGLPVTNTPGQLTPADQANSFGYNCDFCAFFPLPKGSGASDRGILAVNHESPLWPMMFPGDKPDPAVTLASVGISMVEVKKEGDRWEYVENSPYNWRYMGHKTFMDITGPARGNPRMRTAADPLGIQVMGTFENCAGGKTPWGTYLTCEENFYKVFTGNIPEKEKRNYERLTMGQDSRDDQWDLVEPYFSMDKEPNEPNRYGWVVEMDPHNPSIRPKKRTALGRFFHEGAHTVLDPDGRVVVYMGDDEVNEFLYKFVTQDAYTPAQPDLDLLDKGTLYVARFDEKGWLDWLPLIYGQGPLTEANGFTSQADVVIEARTAGTLLGATPMDRPEDVESDPKTGKVYVSLTNNVTRILTNAANPRALNIHGHILELVPPKKSGKPDHAATRFEWDIFLLAGSDDEKHHLSCPDNIAFDGRGFLWIATDGMSKARDEADGLFACALSGEQRAITRRFLKAPAGAEVCGPEFTPDGKTLFVAIQHPGEGSPYATPSTRWPDFDPTIPPRPSVIAITHKGGKRIGEGGKDV